MSLESLPSFTMNDDQIEIDMTNSCNFVIENDNTPKRPKFTDDHFMNKLNDQLEEIRFSENLRMSKNLFFSNETNTPIMMSNNNSDVENDVIDDEYFYEEIIRENCPTDIVPYKKPPLKKLSFRDVNKCINKYYESEDKYSNELDILTTFLKGQKNLYMKSKLITQRKLNMLMIPSLICSSIITIFAPIIQTYSWSGAFISGLNATVAFLVSVVHYLKFESYTEIYTQLTYQYDKLESSLEFTNNKLTFIDNVLDKNELVLHKMKKIEKKINEIKENCNIIIPPEVRKMFPIISNLNIFSFIKKIEVYKQNLIMKFKDIKNEILYIKWKWGDSMESKEKSRLEFLYSIKEKIKDEILNYKNAYGSIDEIFIKEIKQADNISFWNFLQCFGVKQKNITSENPVLKDYLMNIYSE